MLTTKPVGLTLFCVLFYPFFLLVWQKNNPIIFVVFVGFFGGGGNGGGEVLFPSV